MSGEKHALIKARGITTILRRAEDNATVIAPFVVRNRNRRSERIATSARTGPLRITTIFFCRMRCNINRFISTALMTE